MFSFFPKDGTQNVSSVVLVCSCTLTLGLKVFLSYPLGVLPLHTAVELQWLMVCFECVNVIPHVHFFVFPFTIM